MLNGAGVQAPVGNALYATTFKTYDGFGNHTSTTDARGVVTTNQFDALGRVVQTLVFESNGSLLTSSGVAYESGGNVNFTTNALGGVTQTLYTQTGQPYYRQTPDGATNGLTYYLDGRSKNQILPNGSFWQTTYNDASLLVTRTFYTVGGTPLATNVSGFDRRGNQILKVDELGNSFTNGFDGLDRIKFAAGPVVSSPPPTNAPGIPGGGGTGYVPIQQTLTNYYDAAGLATTNVNALGESTITYRDVLGRVTDVEIHNAANALVRIATTAYSVDHQSAITTQGSGSTAIVKTIYTDNKGKPVLTISYPSPVVKEFVLDSYDPVENLISETHNTLSNGTVTTWTTALFAHDGLNRLVAKTDRDGAVTTYAYDQAGNLTTEVMPGATGLTWQAAYNSALQKLFDYDLASGNSITRSNNYTYSTTTGLLQTSTDGRGVTCTHYYDAFLRPATNSYSGSLPEHNMTTVFSYDASSYVTNIAESFSSTNTGPAAAVGRAFDGYHELTADTVSGGAGYTANQSWNSAGRRTGLGLANFGWGFSWQADGTMLSVGGPTGYGSATYTYSTAGQLLTRSFLPRLTTITQRDGDGRPQAINTTVNGTSVLNETLSFTGDGLLATHTLVRPDFTDSRSYTYANLSRRLNQEVVGLTNTTSWTNVFAYDNGTAGGPGVLTSNGQAGGTNVSWKGGTDSFSRVNASTNSVAQRQAYGLLNGTANMTALLDGNPMPVTTVGTNDAYEWRAQLALVPGAHQLIVNALNWSGYYTASATNTFTNNAADRVQNTFAGNGEVTNRVWLNSSNQVIATKSLSWDARDRLHNVTYVDSNTNGYIWSAVYDPLGRRLATTTIFITNGVTVSNLPKTINQYFDPNVEFLELGESDTGGMTWKFYGPDVNGAYGGMQGVGGLEAVVNGPELSSPVVSDARGNGYAVYSQNQASLTWFTSRPTAFGAVQGYQPLPLADGATMAAASAWRGKWADITGLYWLGKRYYDPIAGNWLSADPLGHTVADPALNTLCGGDPVNTFDPDGRGNNPEYGSYTSPTSGQIYMPISTPLNWGTSTGPSVDPNVPIMTASTGNPPPSFNNTIEGSDVAAGFVDTSFGTVLSLFTPHDFTLGPFNDTPEAQFQNNLGQFIQQQYGSPLAQNGLANPNSAGYSLGSAISLTTQFGVILAGASDTITANTPSPSPGPVTIGDYFPGYGPNTMIHLTSSSASDFANGVDVGTYWAQLGNVANLTPLEYRIGVVGPAAAGYGPGANLFVVGGADSSAYSVNSVSAYGYTEYINTRTVQPSGFISVPNGPPLPYPGNVIPPEPVRP